MVSMLLENAVATPRTTNCVSKAVLDRFCSEAFFLSKKMKRPPICRHRLRAVPAPSPDVVHEPLQGRAGSTAGPARRGLRRADFGLATLAARVLRARPSPPGTVPCSHAARRLAAQRAAPAALQASSWPTHFILSCGVRPPKANHLFSPQKRKHPVRSVSKEVASDVHCTCLKWLGRSRAFLFITRSKKSLVKSFSKNCEGKNWHAVRNRILRGTAHCAGTFRIFQRSKNFEKMHYLEKEPT